VKESQDFAKKKDLPVLKNVLLPRKKGFFATMQGLRNTVDAVYDITIVYGDGSQYRPLLSDLALRRGFDVHLHVKRFVAKEVPREEAELETWLNNVWSEKDVNVDYLLKNGEFPNQQNEPYRHLPLHL
jgi:lysocardiolipin and lysophospholipid acyltransferase